MHVSMALFSAKPVIRGTIFGRLVYTVAGGTGLGVIGYVRFEASGLYGAIDEVEATVKDEVKGVKADVQGVKESIARIAGQQEAILKLLGKRYGSAVSGREQPSEGLKSNV